MKSGSRRTTNYGLKEGGAIRCLKFFVFSLLYLIAIMPFGAVVVEGCSQMQLNTKAKVQAQTLELHQPRMEQHNQQVAETDVEENASSSSVDSSAIRMSEEEYQHLVQLVFAESGMEVYSDKLSVAKVVLKRAALSGNTVDDVIWTPGQFEPAQENGTITDGNGNDLAQKELPQDCYLAVAQAIDECNAGDFGPYTGFYGNGPGNGNTFY